MMNHSFDNIFQGKKSFAPKSFEFNQEVARVFDNMLIRSIPFYAENQKLILNVLSKTIKSKDLIYDLGCSTGSLLFLINEKFQNLSLNLKGIDKSQAMIAKAEEKKKDFQASDNIQLIFGDLLDYYFLPANVFIINYTLQFLALEKRLLLLEKIFRSLLPEGILVVSEKVQENDSYFTNMLNKLHEDFKKANFYNSLEITRKRKSLEKILIPQTTDEHIAQFKKAGFTKTTILFKVANFVTFLIKK